MADRFGASLDFSGWDAGLKALAGPIKESLARRMCVTGGVELRDEAKRWVPVKDGLLKRAIYLSQYDKQTSASQITYTVSWNHGIAPHGHLQEFGHWMIWEVVYNAKLGRFQTLATGKGASATGVKRRGGPKRVAAKPFLRPAYSIVYPRLRQLMVERGRAELPALLAEYAP